MAYLFHAPPGWDVPDDFTPPDGWRPDPAWPAAPEGWEFWLPLPDPELPPQPPPPPVAPASAAPASSASQKMSGMFRSLKTKANDEDWMGKAKGAADQAAAAAKQATSQATAAAKQRDKSALDKAGSLPDGALWRGVSHESGRNSIVTLFPDRIERTKPTSKMSLTGMLAGGPEDLEVIPTKSISSVQVKRGPWYHDVTIYASGNTIVFSVDAADAETLRGLVMDQVIHGSSSSSAPAMDQPARATAADGDVVLEQIRKLGELRDAGILSDEEFATKKAQLLERL